MEIYPRFRENLQTKPEDRSCALAVVPLSDPRHVTLLHLQAHPGENQLTSSPTILTYHQAGSWLDYASSHTWAALLDARSNILTRYGAEPKAQHSLLEAIDNGKVALREAIEAREALEDLRRAYEDLRRTSWGSERFDGSASSEDHSDGKKELSQQLNGPVLKGSSTLWLPTSTTAGAAISKVTSISPFDAICAEDAQCQPSFDKGQ